MAMLCMSITPSLTTPPTSTATVEVNKAKQVKSRVLILGATGRVGGSTALALSKLSPDLQLLLGGRNKDKGESMVATIGANSEFAQVNIDDAKSLEAILSDVDLVVHTAGPFQQAEKCSVLEAAIRTQYHYVTVMAAELVRAARSENKGEPQRLRFYYYTAGSGGAGPTILATSFLLLGEEVVAYNKGKRIELKPYTGKLNIDFGKGIGKKDVYLLNLPEVKSTHEILGVPTVSARFGTAPFFWNWGMVAMTKLFPMEFLRDRNKVQQLVKLFDPSVRVVDGISGERVSMRVDLECSDGRHTLGLYSHKKLSVSVGVSTAAFALAILEGSTQPGVWFPEEPEGIAVEAREVLLQRASQGTINFVMNKAPWMVETDPKEVILGIYV
uniref:Saccharopine dehydrogenase NADP binding domain-containing protein n=1 Tax=Daucus carota subsp. sativus TaxID=79200 RepID=A0A161ZKT9_DAUCS